MYKGIEIVSYVEGLVIRLVMVELLNDSLMNIIIIG